jgi:glucokinase
VAVENDANVAVLGEARYGKGAGHRSCAFIGLGTGVGFGLVRDNKLYEGDTEFGHHVIDFRENAEQCTCIPEEQGGKKGCFEAYASATALIRDIKRAMMADRNSLMWQHCQGFIDTVTPKTAFDCAEQGDKTANAVVDNYVRAVGVGATNAVNSYDPEVLVIGGGVSNQGEKLIKPVQQFVSANKYPTGKDVKVLQAHEKAGLVGAASLVER